jgi:MSHA pilin protein MshD
MPNAIPNLPQSVDRRPRATTPVRRRLRGLSMVELLVFIVIVSAALVGVLAALLPGSRASADPMLRRQAQAIAEALLEEVQLMPFTWCDADDANVETATSAAGCATTPEAAGPEPGEGRFAPPSFDHVNDYNGYTLAGIVDLTNTPIAALAGYSASVGVAAADLGSLTSASGHALRITVTVTGPHGTSVTLDGWRTRHAPNAAF